MPQELKGHAFDFDHDRCLRCGMTKGQFEDAGEPVCTGHKPELRPEEEQSTRRSSLRPDK